MKKIISILTVFLSFFLFPQTSLSEWTLVVENLDNGGKYYVDFDRIRQKNGYVYYWSLGDFKKPIMDNYISSKVYEMGDCEIFRKKILTFSVYEGRMGQGKSETFESSGKWEYPEPGSTIETTLRSVCEKI